MNRSEVMCPIDIYHKASQDENFKINTSVPAHMTNDLLSKKIVVQSFYIENTRVPMFIPQRLITPDPIRQVSSSVVNYASINPTRNSDSLGYTISLTSQNNDFGLDLFVQHEPTAGILPPLTYPNTDVDFQTNQ